MIRGRLRAAFWGLLESFGFRKVAECPECGRWYPVWGPGENIAAHLFREAA